MNNTEKNPAVGCALERRVMRIRLAIVRAVCWMLLPKNLWVGKHHGAFTCRHKITLGKLDGRGVLQGVIDPDAGA